MKVSKERLIKEKNIIRKHVIKLAMFVKTKLKFFIKEHKIV